MISISDYLFTVTRPDRKARLVDLHWRAPSDSAGLPIAIKNMIADLDCPHRRPAGRRRDRSVKG
jgi:hypothetical protein